MSFDPINTNPYSRDNNVNQPPPFVNKSSKGLSESRSSNFQPTTQDVLRLSSDQEEYDNLVNAIKQSPDIREERVKKVKKSLESGDYHISTEDIADRIIHDTILHNTRKLP
ncbi:flagellar biosynthesis anti-sigma factor FlgM [Candidatus Nitrospira salsa]|nr:MAG: hypothetical protein NPIRA01_25150 [Nitrospirales bacterium]